MYFIVFLFVVGGRKTDTDPFLLGWLNIWYNIRGMHVARLKILCHFAALNMGFGGRGRGGGRGNHLFEAKCTVCKSMRIIPLNC